MRRKAKSDAASRDASTAASSSHTPGVEQSSVTGPSNLDHEQQTQLISEAAVPADSSERVVASDAIQPATEGRTSSTPKARVPRKRIARFAQISTGTSDGHDAPGSEHQQAMPSTSTSKPKPKPVRGRKGEQSAKSDLLTSQSAKNDLVMGVAVPPTQSSGVCEAHGELSQPKPVAPKRGRGRPRNHPKTAESSGGDTSISLPASKRRRLTRISDTLPIASIEAQALPIAERTTDGRVGRMLITRCFPKLSLWQDAASTGQTDSVSITPSSDTTNHSMLSAGDYSKPSAQINMDPAENESTLVDIVAGAEHPTVAQTEDVSGSKALEQDASLSSVTLSPGSASPRRGRGRPGGARGQPQAASRRSARVAAQV